MLFSQLSNLEKQVTLRGLELVAANEDFDFLNASQETTILNATTNQGNVFIFIDHPEMRGEVTIRKSGNILTAAIGDMVYLEDYDLTLSAQARYIVEEFGDYAREQMELGRQDITPIAYNYYNSNTQVQIFFATFKLFNRAVTAFLEQSNPEIF